MIILVCALLAIASVPLAGGDLRRMAALPIRWVWLVWAAIGIQTILVSAPWSLPDALAEVVHLGTYALAGAFAAANLRLPSASVIAAGGAMNLAAIAANGGVMPAAPGAVRLAGKTAEDGFTNSGAVDDARLAWLGDVFAIPAGWPFANVFSVGDIVIVIGVALLAHRWCRRSATGSVSAAAELGVGRGVSAAGGAPALEHG